MLTIGDHRILRRIIVPIGVLLIPVASYPMDRWLFTKTQLSRQLALLGLQDPLFVSTVVSGVVPFIICLAQGWIALACSRPSVPVSLMVLVISLVFYICPYLPMSFAWVP